MSATKPTDTQLVTLPAASQRPVQAARFYHRHEGLELFDAGHWEIPPRFAEQDAQESPRDQQSPRFTGFFQVTPVGSSDELRSLAPKLASGV
jgi:hypothetical protein